MSGTLLPFDAVCAGSTAIIKSQKVNKQIEGIFKRWIRKLLPIKVVKQERLPIPADILVDNLSLYNHQGLNFR